MEEFAPDENDERMSDQQLESLRTMGDDGGGGGGGKGIELKGNGIGAGSGQEIGP
jgi:EKC/KEOPS complex subunit PCC1/LAGE3